MFCNATWNYNLTLAIKSEEEVRLIQKPNLLSFLTLSIVSRDTPSFRLLDFVDRISP